MNNPLKYTDPSGEFKINWNDIIAGAAIVVGVAMVVVSGGTLTPLSATLIGSGLAHFGAAYAEYSRTGDWDAASNNAGISFGTSFDTNWGYKNDKDKKNGVAKNESVVESISNTNIGGGKNNNVRGEKVLDASQTTKLTSGYYTVPAFAVQGYSTQTFHEGSGYSESVYDFQTRKLESTNFKTLLGNYSLGVDGSFSYGNSFVSFGTTPNNVYTLDLSIPTGRSSSLGTTLYFSPQQFRKHMNHIINNIGQSLSKVWYAYPMTPQGIPYFTEF